MGLCIIIPEAEVYQGADTSIAFCCHKDAGSSRHTGPMEDTGVYWLVDPCLVFGHQYLWRFESTCLQKLYQVHEDYPVRYLAYWWQFLRYFCDKYLGQHRQDIWYFLWPRHG